MAKLIAKNRFILLMLSIILCLSCAYGLTAKLDPDVSALGEKVSGSDYSWATISDAAARYLNITASPGGQRGAGVETPDASTGFAGNFLGYVAPDDGTMYAIGSMETNTTIYSYTSLKKMNEFLKNSPNGGWTESAQLYSGFGYALTASGIDEPVIIGQTADDKRNIIGPIVLIIFLLCMALPQFFEMVLTFLSVANPFRLFLGSNSVLKSIVPSIGLGSGFDNQNSAISAAMSNALTTLSDTVTGLYNALYSLSFFAIIPIMIALALFSWLVLRGRASSIFRKLATRIVFIGLGVPLLLACYTAAIDSVKDFTINTATGTPITVIASTFCDYGSWVLGSAVSGYDYMRLPTTVTLKVDESRDSYVYDNTSTSDRRLVQAVNDSVYGTGFGGTALSDSMDANSIAADDSALVNSVQGMASADKTASVINMLQSYTKGEYITASNLATKFNAAIAGERYDDAKQKFNALSTSWERFEPTRAIAASYQNANDASISIPEADVKTFAEQRLKGAGMFSTVNTFYMTTSPNFRMDGTTAVYEGTNQAPMSRMAAYNLLSSTFSDTAIAAYSTTAASTNQVQLAHYAVSIAGQGYMEIAYVFDACAIMACLMVLGYGYGFALLFACFKGLIQMFPKVLTGMLGSMRGIAGACALVAALIVEILGTCIMYALSSMLIGGIYDLIEGPLATLLTTVVNLPQQAAALITVVSSAVIIIKLTTLLLKYRTAVVKSVSETATGFINKFMETNVVAPNLESGISAGGLASAGIGLAMVGASTPVGNKLADRASSLTDKVTNADADKVATAAMGGQSSTGKYGEKYADPNAANASSEHKTSADLRGTASSDSGGTYSSGNNHLADTSESAGNEADKAKTPDELAAGYVDSNADDFEKEIGLASNDKAGEGSETSKDYAVNDGDNDVTDVDASGRSLVDNSTEELTGTRTTDVTGTKAGEAAEDGKSVPVEGNDLQDQTDAQQTSSTASGNTPASKMVMKDKHGNEQEVSIVNAKTGKAYTQADKEAGEGYDVIGADGKSIYADQKGYSQLTGGMSANTIALKDGQPAIMMGPGSDGSGGLNPYGGGAAYTLEPASVQTASAEAAPVSSGSAPAPAGVQAAMQSAPIPAAAAMAGAMAASNVVQNVNQTNVTQNTANNTANTANTSHMQSVEQVSQTTTSQVTTQQYTDAGNAGASVATGGNPVTNTTREVTHSAGSPTNVHVTADSSGAAPGSTYVNMNAPAQSSGSQTVQTSSEREVYRTTEREVSSGQQTAPTSSANVNITNHNQTNVNSTVSGESSRDNASLGTGSIPNNRRRR